MKYQLFQFELPSEGDTSELNQFIASHRVTGVSQYIVRSADAPLLVFVIEYIDGQKPSPPQSKAKIDHRKSLSDPQDIVFSQLRDWRKKVADAAGLPVYNILNNAQLVEIIKRNARTRADLAAIPGIGKSRVEKYGDEVLAVLADFLPLVEPSVQVPTEPPTESESL